MKTVFCYETVNGKTILAEEVKIGTLTYLKNPFRLEKIEGQRHEVFELAHKLVEYSVAIFARKFPVQESVVKTYWQLAARRLRGELMSARDIKHSLSEYLDITQPNPQNN